MATIDSYVSVMIDGLKKKTLILNQIIECSNKEKVLLSAEQLEMEDFNINMKEKSTLIDALTLLDDGFTVVYNRVKVELETDKIHYEAQIKQMKTMIARITELSVKIQTEEARNKELAQRQFGKMKKEVKTVKRSEQMAANYYKSMSMVDTEPQFLDKKK